MQKLCSLSVLHFLCIFCAKARIFFRCSCETGEDRVRRNHLSCILGAPQLGVYPIDPMRVNKLQLTSGTGTVSLDLTFSDMDIHGFKGLRIDQVK